MLCNVMLLDIRLSLDIFFPELSFVLLPLPFSDINRFPFLSIPTPYPCYVPSSFPKNVFVR